MIEVDIFSRLFQRLAQRGLDQMQCALPFLRCNFQSFRRQGNTVKFLRKPYTCRLALAPNCGKNVLHSLADFRG
jgi:hypothetical protein